jgi:EAL domain-containing protein (putative c-di-GMP-specific phosphodiesterase class I)
LRIAVNVCGRQLRRSDFVDGLGRLLDTYQVGPGRLEVEVAESVTAELSDAMIVLFQELRSLGVTLSIDDFGTGYSSLGRLKLLPIQKIKLDRSFVADIETDNNDATICAASVALAHSLGLAVVAEGVETEPQFAYLRALDTDLMQGYYFCEPLPIDQLMAFLASHSPTAAS